VRKESSRQGAGRLPGQIDGKDASNAGPIAHRKGPAVGFDAAAADGQSQTEAGAIPATLLKWPKQLFGLTWGEAAALIFDLDEDAAGRCMSCATQTPIWMVVPLDLEATKIDATLTVAYLLHFEAGRLTIGGRSLSDFFCPLAPSSVVVASSHVQVMTSDAVLSAEYNLVV
jgi:hypothetical protein